MKKTHRYKDYRNKPYWKEIGNSYRAMVSRCKDKNNEKYKNYGAKGITICQEWLIDGYGRINFYNWAINNGYSKGFTIDRIDTYGNYEPNNCRWANDIVQANNKTNNFMITYKGICDTIHNFSRKYNISVGTLRYRITHNWDVEKALTIPAIVGRNQYNKGCD